MRHWCRLKVMDNQRINSKVFIWSQNLATNRRVKNWMFRVHKQWVSLNLNFINSDNIITKAVLERTTEAVFIRQLPHVQVIEECVSEVQMWSRRRDRTIRKCPRELESLFQLQCIRGGRTTCDVCLSVVRWLAVATLHTGWGCLQKLCTFFRLLCFLLSSDEITNLTVKTCKLLLDRRFQLIYNR